MLKNNQRRAFTLTELLVVIAIIALLVTLVIPAIQSPRGGSSLKISCRNNMKQLTLALQNHSDSYRCFPPLYFSNDPANLADPALSPADLADPALSPADASDYYSWQTRILPFIEEDTLYKSVSAKSKKFTMPSSSVKVPVATSSTDSPGTIRMNQLICPSYPGDFDTGLSNYVAISSTRLPLLLKITQDKDGQPAYKQEPDGMLIPEKTQRGYPMTRMKDGTSKTAVLIESVENVRSNWYDPQQGFVVGFLPADSTPINAAASNYYPYYGPHQAGTVAAPAPARWQFNPTAGNRTALAVAKDPGPPAIPYHPVKGDPLERTWGPSSAHMGGIIIVGMGDGSVMEITTEIDPAVFFAAITARGAEAVQPLGN